MLDVGRSTIFPVTHTKGATATVNLTTVRAKRGTNTDCEQLVGCAAGLIVNLLVVAARKRENPAINAVASRRDKRGGSTCIGIVPMQTRCFLR